MSKHEDRIANHYRKVWGRRGLPKTWSPGRRGELPPDFRILAFPPCSRREMWTYATCGMSQPRDADPLELHLFSRDETEAHVELLYAVAHFHRTGSPLSVGHTVNFGRPWLDGSRCDHGLVSLPYLDGPTLEWLDAAEDRVRFLWLVPVTPEEVAFKKARGLEALEEQFEKASFNYLDPTRGSVVESREAGR